MVETIGAMIVYMLIGIVFTTFAIAMVDDFDRDSEAGIVIFCVFFWPVVAMLALILGLMKGIGFIWEAIYSLMIRIAMRIRK